MWMQIFDARAKNLQGSEGISLWYNVTVLEPISLWYNVNLLESISLWYNVKQV